MIEEKINAIRNACTLLRGSVIQRFETAEILLDDGTWDDWPDLPIRIYCSGEKLLSISWSRFDDLWLSNDTSLPFETEGMTVRWKTNGINSINSALGHTIRGVSLGRGGITVEANEMEIWNRVVFDLGDKWLEVFNLLDDNGYDLHLTSPEGEFRTCV